MKRKALLILGIIQAFVAIGALPASYILIVHPDGSELNMTVKVLEGSPFKDFLIPGLFLFTVNGLFNLANAVLCFVKYKYAPHFGFLLGTAPLSGYLSRYTALV